MLRLLAIMLISCLSEMSLAQKVEYSEIHWGYSDKVMKKLHLKEVILFEGVSKEELRKRTDEFIDWYLSEDKFYEYVSSETSKRGWFLTEGEPHSVDNMDRIWTKYVSCKDCIKTFKNAKVGAEGKHRMDFRFKDGKVLLVMGSFYTGEDNVSPEDWMVKNDKLALDADDPRVLVLEEYFLTIRNEFAEYVSNPDKLKFGDKIELKLAVDGW